MNLLFNKYTVEELETLPINILRGLDITSPEEEKLVQAVVSKRLADAPLEDPFNVSHFTDDLTPQHEKELQAYVDRKVAKRKGLDVELLPLPAFLKQKGRSRFANVVTNHQ